MPNCKTVVPYRGTPEQEERLRQVIAEHKGQPGATMPVLQAAQEIFGYLPEEVQIMVAEGLDIPLSEVYGVASFYAQFTLNPKGRYQISVCLGTACYVKGAASHPQRRGTEAGHCPRLHHAGRKVLAGFLPLCGRLRSGPGHDDQQRRLWPPHPRSGGSHSGHV